MKINQDSEAIEMTSDDFYHLLYESPSTSRDNYGENDNSNYESTEKMSKFSSSSDKINLSLLSLKEYRFVSFFTTWCGHCTTLHHELVLLNRKTNISNLPVSIINVDMTKLTTATTSLIGTEDIQGYPTIYLYHYRDIISMYNGTRTYANIYNFLERKVLPQGIGRIESISDVQNIVTKLNYNNVNRKYFEDEIRQWNNQHPKSRKQKPSPAFNQVLYEKENRNLLFDDNLLLASDIMSFVLLLLPNDPANLSRRVHDEILHIIQRINYDCTYLIIKYSDDQALIDYFNVKEDTLIIFNTIDNEDYYEAYYGRSDHEAFPSYTYLPITDNLFVNHIMENPEPINEQNINHYILAAKQMLYHHLFPIILHYSLEIQPLLRLLPITSHVLVFHDSSMSNTGSTAHDVEIFNILEDMARRFRGKLIFLFIDITVHHHITQVFRVSRDTVALPYVVIVNMDDPDNALKYKFYDFEIDYQELVNHEEEYEEVVYNPKSMESDVETMGDSSMKQHSETVTVCDKSNEAYHEEECLIAMNYERAIIKRTRLVAAFETHYRPADLNNIQDVSLFFEKYLSNKIPKSVDTESYEELDELNERLGYGVTNHVENIGAINFYQRVLENDQDCLVYWHLPWCAHCKSMDAIIQEVAYHYLTVDGERSLLVYRINGIENDLILANLKILGYPTVFLFKADDKTNPIEYLGARNTEPLISWIEVNRHQGSPSESQD